MRLQRLTGPRAREDPRGVRRDAEADRALPGDPRRRARAVRRSSSTSCARCARSTATSAAPRSSTRRPRSRIEDLIAEEDMVVTVTHDGYIKRNAVADLPRPAPRRPRQDRRDDQGGGLRRAPVRRLDPRLHPVLHHQRHACYWIKVHELPQAGRAARGKAIVNLLNLQRRTRRSPPSCRCASSSRAATCSSPPARHGEEDRARRRTPTRARRHHRHQARRGRRGDRRAPHRRRAAR